MTEGELQAKNQPWTFANAAWNEFVYAGYLVAVGDAFTLWALGTIAGIPVTWSFLVIVFLCVFAGNLYNRRTESEHDALGNDNRAKVMAKYIRAFYPITVVSLGVVALLLLRFANVAVLLYAAALVTISLLYTALLKPLTKYVVGFKSYAGALMYALMLPLMAAYYGYPLNVAVFLVFVFYYLRIFISNAACDIKDTESDAKRGLKTFAVYCGDKRTAQILRILNAVSAVPIVLGIYLGVLPMFSVAILLTIPYAYYYLMPRQAMDNQSLASIVIDGEFLLWLPLVLIGRVFL